MEASGHARCLERLLGELNFELWIGEATEIARKSERKQKTERQDAQPILRLLLKDDFATDLGSELGKPRSAETVQAIVGIPYTR
jgi:hypothetical protein